MSNAWQPHRLAAFWYPPILTYHRVHPKPATDTPTMTPEVFARQMMLLARAWQPVSMARLVEGLDRRAGLPLRAVAVTFDDGTEDTFQYAYPILVQHQIPATVFMIAANVGQPGFLTRDQLRQMGAGGVACGSHTVHHAYLPSLLIQDARRELEEAKHLLEQIVGTTVDFLSYPGGGFTPAVRELGRAVGYRAACTTNRGLQRFPVDQWALRRITMHASVRSGWGLWLRCCGYYQLTRRLRAPA